MDFYDAALQRKEDKDKLHAMRFLFEIPETTFCRLNYTKGYPSWLIPSKSRRLLCLLESHARRIYGMVLEPTFEAFPSVSKAEELLAWMKKQSISAGQPLKRRFILRYSKFRSSKELDPLLSDLVQMGYLLEAPARSFSVVS